MKRKRVLIANRGEIAVRIIKACEESDLETILVVSEADQDSLPARLADKVVCIGPPQVTQSYLNIPMIMATAKATGADAIHPGYGWLSERAHFARAYHSAGVTLKRHEGARSGRILSCPFVSLRGSILRMTLQ